MVTFDNSNDTEALFSMSNYNFDENLFMGPGSMGYHMAIGCSAN